MWSRTKANIGFVSFEIEPHRDKQTQIVAPRHTVSDHETDHPTANREMHVTHVGTSIWKTFGYLTVLYN